MVKTPDTNLETKILNILGNIFPETTFSNDWIDFKQFYYFTQWFLKKYFAKTVKLKRGSRLQYDL